MNQSIPFRSPASTKADARGLMLSSKRSLKNIKARYSPQIETLKSAATIATDQTYSNWGYAIHMVRLISLRVIAFQTRFKQLMKYGKI